MWEGSNEEMGQINHEIVEGVVNDVVKPTQRARNVIG